MRTATPGDGLGWRALFALLGRDSVKDFELRIERG
jgi:hypothetical protein